MKSAVLFALLLTLSAPAADFKPDQSKLPVAPPKGARVLLDEKGEHSFLSMAGEKIDWPFADGALYHEITLQGYVEGPVLFVRNGRYYFMWSEGGWTGPDYSVAYAVAKLNYAVCIANWGGSSSGYAIASNQLDVGSGGDIFWSATSFGVNQKPSSP